MAHTRYKADMEVNPNKPIGEIALEYDGAIELFEDRNINYAFGGRQSLQDACEQAEASLPEITSLLGKMKHSTHEERPQDWSHWRIRDLIDLIVNRQHRYLRLRLSVFCKKSTELAKSGEGAGPSFAEINELILDFAQHFEEHMKEEEEFVFPHLKNMEMAEAQGEKKSNPYHELKFKQHPIAILTWKHEMVWHQWASLRKLTNYFRPSPGSSPEFIALCRGLKEFHDFLQQHGHLEDNILFRKAIEKRYLD